jgi:hypothetical protein
MSKIGDVFEVELPDGLIGFFQYIANDPTQLGSEVIRVFRKKCRQTERPTIPEIVSGQMHFAAHVFLQSGLRFSSWRKIGSNPIVTRDETLFRDSDDYGNPEIVTSNRWYVWKIAEEMQFVGKLGPAYRHAEIGVVVAPDQIAERMKTGSYSFVYPQF